MACLWSENAFRTCHSTAVSGFIFLFCGKQTPLFLCKLIWRVDFGFRYWRSLPARPVWVASLLGVFWMTSVSSPMVQSAFFLRSSRSVKFLYFLLMETKLAKPCHFSSIISISCSLSASSHASDQRTRSLRQTACMRVDTTPPCSTSKQLAHSRGRLVHSLTKYVAISAGTSLTHARNFCKDLLNSASLFSFL